MSQVSGGTESPMETEQPVNAVGAPCRAAHSTGLSLRLVPSTLGGRGVTWPESFGWEMSCKDGTPDCLVVMSHFG